MIMKGELVQLLWIITLNCKSIVKEKKQVKTNSPHTLELIQHVLTEVKSTSPNMATKFHARLSQRFMQLICKLIKLIKAQIF